MNVILFPYVRRTWHVAQPSPQILRRLDRALLKESAPAPTKSIGYRGTVEGELFRFRRAINYTNYFLPVVQGRVQAEDSGASVRVLISPKLLVLALQAIWALFWIQIFFIGLLVPEIWISPLTSAVIFALTYGLMLASFRAEARRIVQFLSATLGETQ